MVPQLNIKAQITLGLFLNKIMSYIFVLTPFGLIRLIAPFRLVVLDENQKRWKKGQVILATSAVYHPEFLIAFEIDKHIFPYDTFDILL